MTFKSRIYIALAALVIATLITMLSLIPAEEISFCTVLPRAAGIMSVAALVIAGAFTFKTKAGRFAPFIAIAVFVLTLFTFGSLGVAFCPVN